MALRSCGAGRRCRWTQFLSIGTPWLPHNALEWHVAVQMNVTRIWFCGVLLHLFPINANDSTAAGIYAEATEKLYERHYLVIKIVSSFFCLSDKVFVSLSIDLQ